MLKGKVVSLFLSKTNMSNFSHLVDSFSFLRFPYKIISQRLMDFDFPQHIFLEATNACNLKCDICPRNSNTIKREIGFMDFGLFKKVVDEAAFYGARSYCLHIFGEPLLATDIVKMLEYIKNKNSKNVILLTTNGVLLDENISQRLVELNVDRVVVSVIAARQETYKEITQFDNLKKVEANIMKLALLKKSKSVNKPDIYVRMINNDKTGQEKRIFAEKWRGRGVVIDIRDAHNYAGKIKNNILKKNLKQRYPCYHLWFSPAINYDGDVSICCCDWAREAVLGNVKNQLLSDIWKSDLIKTYRLYHLSGRYGKIPLCAKCDVWSTYPDIFFKWQKYRAAIKFAILDK